MDEPTLQHVVGKLTMMSDNLDEEIDHPCNTQSYIRGSYARVWKGTRRVGATKVAIKTDLYYRDNELAIRASNNSLSCDRRAEN